MTSSASTVGSAQSLLAEDADDFIYIQGSPISPLSPSETESNEPSVVYIQNEMFLLPRAYEVEGLVKKTESGNMICSGVANKTEHVAIHKKKPSSDLAKQKSMLRDIRVMMHLNQVPNQNVIHLRDIVEPISYQAFRDMYYVTDLLDGNLGELIQKHRDDKTTLSEKQVASIVRQMLIGAKHISDAGLVHRNISPSTVLAKFHSLDVKLAHFENVRSKEYVPEPLKDIASEFAYRAPELLFGSEKLLGSQRSDVWSIGCIMAELLGADTLFKGENAQQTLETIVNFVGSPESRDMKYLNEQGMEIISRMPPVTHKRIESIVPGSSPLAADLMFKMLQFNKDRRISLQDAIEHPFFASLGKVKKPKHALKMEAFDFLYEEELIDSSAVKKKCYSTIEEFVEIKNEIRRAKLQQRSRSTIMLQSLQDRLTFKAPPSTASKSTSTIDLEVAPRKRKIAQNIEKAWAAIKPIICCCCV
jgi:mitogen-activated protein kinase 1/3